MYYEIVGLCPRTDIDMGAHGFQINLHPKWKALVAASGIDQIKVDHAIVTLGNSWLDACGYGRKSKREMSMSDKEERAYEARSSIRVTWGEWGPEHITVPGNACGLDFDKHAFGSPLGGPALLPHNVDSWRQVQLLLIVFTFLAESMTIQSWEKIKRGEV